MLNSCVKYPDSLIVFNTNSGLTHPMWCYDDDDDDYDDDDDNDVDDDEYLRSAI